MLATIVVNVRSGRGRGVTLADAVERALIQRGVECRRAKIGAPDADLHRACHGANALVVAGGDGSVRSMVPFALKHKLALAIVPTGTENLGSKAFGFGTTADQLAEAIAGGRARRIDVGRANLSPFLIVASIGFDADLVHRVNAARTGPIRRATYVRSALGMVLGWRPPVMRVTVARKIVFEGAGQLVVANCRQYAAGLDPVRAAMPDDGLLSYAVLPATGVAAVAKWALRLTSAQWKDAGALTGSARHIEVELAEPRAIQVDGDPLAGVRSNDADFSIDAGALAVVGDGQELPEHVQKLPQGRR